jgi:hypothetical protein
MNHEHTQRQEQNDEKLQRPSGPSIGRCKTIGGQLKGWLAISEFGFPTGEGTAQTAAIVADLAFGSLTCPFQLFSSSKSFDISRGHWLQVLGSSTYSCTPISVLLLLVCVCFCHFHRCLLEKMQLG